MEESESSAPYRRLNSKTKHPRSRRWRRAFRRLFCLGTEEPTTEAHRERELRRVHDRVDEAIRLTDMKIRHYQFQITELTCEARELVESGDRSMGKEKLLLRNKKARNKEKFAQLWRTLSSVKEDMEALEMTRDLAGTMQVASTKLDEALQEFSVEDIETLVADLQDNAFQIQEINNTLAETDGGTTLGYADEEAIARELAEFAPRKEEEEEEEEIVLPSLPPKKPQKESIKLV